MANVLSTTFPTVTSMIDCTFSGNSAAAGGGMYNNESGPILVGCAFTENTASQSGGGMYSESNSGSHMTACTFSGNTAAVSGGGIYKASSGLTLINSSFTGNTAGLGGGIFIVDAWPILDYCTFTGNSADHGSGIYDRGASWVVVVNAILWGDALDEVFNEGEDSITAVSYSDVQGGYSGASIIDADPRFLDPLNGDLHLMPGSPCIHAGTNDYPLNISHDFEADPRIFDGDGDGTATANMGIDEVMRVHYFIRLPLVLR